MFRRRPAAPRKAPAKTLIVLGSGGHTAEMLTLMDSMDKSLYSPRTYVVAATDPMSAPKALVRERLWQKTDTPVGVSLLQIPRSREVGQSYVTSVATTLYSLIFAFSLVLVERPELVRGMVAVLGLTSTQIVYVESIARTRRFSLSAKLLYHLRLADLLFVQWEQLAKTYPRAVYAGRLY
ncbi:hypothetical protein GPECTOR_4g1000 [Gonium pectorale]|uniref:UDP-N-acetylglucosamine transferase subunit ALG14 n=1 Tax=Gonium pectorale TaxID=33097 RepID=A0A150GXA4_GONPE|nr:hypothetical protein GPECTOR_4g1000 [Gonium pectorale]|eukprot:KXZ54449.1 hypothetical protein GPECTOR_4g1000 [Gonium pectorale]